jgi:hypothetical protein
VGRKNRGRPQAAVDDRRARFTKFIEPEIGHLAMRDVTPNHLRGIVEKLDDRVRERIAFYERDDADDFTGHKPGLSGKTAAHVWSEVTAGFNEACRSKRSDLRIEALVNPRIGVAPPIKMDEREQTRTSWAW